MPDSKQKFEQPHCLQEIGGMITVSYGGLAMVNNCAGA